MPYAARSALATMALALSALLPISLSAFATVNAERELVFLTWEDYIDPAIVSAFEQQTNAKVRFQYFESDDERDAILVKSNHSAFDLVVVNSPNFPVYRRQGWLEPLTHEDIPNLRNLSSYWLRAVSEAQGYGIPYFWGTTGIAYRKDLVPEAIDSWEEFFRPREELRGRLALINNSRDVIGMALKALGYSANSTDRREVAEAGALLMKQKPFVRSMSYVSLNEDSALVTGTVWATMMYNGDAIMVSRHHPEIAYEIPKEGGEIWIDYLAILSASRNKDLAKEFIDFVNTPENAARNALFVYYATPNLAAEKFLPDEFLANPLIYPPRAVLQRCESYIDLPPKILKQRNSIFSSLLD